MGTPEFKLVSQAKLVRQPLFLRSNRNLCCTDAMQTAGAGN